MRFKQFLSEADEREMSFEDGCKAIARECKSFLKDSRGLPLYRGIRLGAEGLSGNFFYTPHPTNRVPKDSDGGFNLMFNSMIELSHGIPQIRRTSYFATGSDLQADAFGLLCFIFPVGQTNILWSDDIKDSFDNDNPLLAKISNELNQTISVSGLRAIFRAMDQQKVSLLNSTDKDRQAVYDIVKKTYETSLMLQPEDGLYKIEWVSLEGKDIHLMLRQALKKAGLAFYKEGPMRAAIDSQKEIIVYKSNGYYTISYNQVIEQMIEEKNIVRHLSYRQVYDWLLQQIPQYT